MRNVLTTKMGGLAVDWAASRGVASEAVQQGRHSRGMIRPIIADHRGIVSLKDTRTSQYKELRETLSKGPDLRIR